MVLIDPDTDFPVVGIPLVMRYVIFGSLSPFPSPSKEVIYSSHFRDEKGEKQRSC